MPGEAVIRRIGQLADGWFVLCDPAAFTELRTRISQHAEGVGRDPEQIGTEAGVAVVGPRAAEWQDRVSHWYGAGLTHLCLRTLGGGLSNQEHIEKLQEVVGQLPIPAP
jgi:alkanesulfonate monooxygenase SsuD/methylene tetrahydromethanopterin reductase-like flavin-dependent oxidoreductase (luciferase family)